MRKSSRGNPYHDERGRFCSRGRAVGAYVNGRSVSLEEYDRMKAENQLGDEYYNQRTKERFEKNDESIRTLGDLQEHGWTGGVYDLNGGSVWSKDGYTLVTARHGDPIEADGYTKRVGDKVEFYSKDGQLIATMPADEAEKYKTTKADSFTIRTPDGETYQLKSLDDANKFVEADKQAHFGQIQKRFENHYDDYDEFNPGRIKQPIELIEHNGVTAVALDNGIMFHCEGRDYVYGETDYDNEKWPYSVSYTRATESTHYQFHGIEMSEYQDFRKSRNEPYKSNAPYSEGLWFITHNDVTKYVLVDTKTGAIVHTDSEAADYTNDGNVTVLKDGRVHICSTFYDGYDEGLLLFWDNGDEFESNYDREFPELVKKVNSTKIE